MPTIYGSSRSVRLMQAGANAATFLISAKTLSDPFVEDGYQAVINWFPTNATSGGEGPIYPDGPDDNGFSNLPSGPLKDLLAKQYGAASFSAAFDDIQAALGAAGFSVTVTRTDEQLSLIPSNAVVYDTSGTERIGVRVKDSTEEGALPRALMVRISVAYSAST